jgi:DNA-binding NarL/FixJ family response regulator
MATDVQHKIRVMLVNDDPNMRQLWQDFLAIQSDMVCAAVAANGVEAVQIAQDIQPDIVVMDIMMPLMNGLDATRHIVKALPNTQIIMYSVRTDYEQEAFAAGAVKYVQIPVTSKQLVNEIRDVYRLYRKNDTPNE